MKIRILTVLGLVLGLSGCATYSYVDDGGGYYHGQSTTVYRGYDYYPGASYGLGYGYYGYPAYDRRYHDYRYRPRPLPPPHLSGQQHGPRPPHPGAQRPPQPSRNGQAPWRDLERVRDAQTRPGLRSNGPRPPVSTSGGNMSRDEAGASRQYIRPAVPQGQASQRMQQPAARPQRSEGARAPREVRPMGRNVRQTTKEN